MKGESNFSCVIPTLGRHGPLFELLEKLTEQTLLPSEIIIVDQTTPISEWAQAQYRELAERLPILVVATSPLGSGGARNLGIELASTGIIVFLDDDVVPARNDHFEKHVAWFENPIVAAIDGAYFPNEGTQHIDREHVDLSDRDLVMAFTTTYWRSGSFRPVIGLCGGNFSARRTALIEVGGFDERFGFGDDRDLGLRLWKAGLLSLNDHSLRAHHKSHPVGGLRAQRSGRMAMPNPLRFAWMLAHFHRDLARITRREMIRRSVGKSWRQAAKLPLRWANVRRAYRRAVEIDRRTKPIYLGDRKRQYSILQLPVPIAVAQ
jgi:GT2 family glycosyltransferase